MYWEDMDTLPSDFLQNYDYEKDQIYVDLLIESREQDPSHDHTKWISTGWPWRDIGYMASCCKERGMYAIRFAPHAITHVRVRVFPPYVYGWQDSSDSSDDNFNPIHDFILNQQQLRRLAREYQVRMGYLEYH